MFSHSSRSLCLGLLGLFAISQAHASISLSATRLVFDGQHKEAGITVRNSGDAVLIQSWIDTDSADANSVPLQSPRRWPGSVARSSSYCG